MRGFTLGSILLVVTACSRSDEPKPRERLVPKSTLTGTLPKHMRNCPSGVTTAETVSSATVDGVDLTITSKDAAARQDILERAQLQARQPDPFWFFPEHSGLHGGPGTLGRCPIIHANTNVTYVELADGVRIHVAARDPSAVAQLQQATEARMHALVRPSS